MCVHVCVRACDQRVDCVCVNRACVCVGCVCVCVPSVCECVCVMRAPTSSDIPLRVAAVDWRPIHILTAQGIAVDIDSGQKFDTVVL